jgi:hypothetical protein
LLETKRVHRRDAETQRKQAKSKPEIAEVAENAGGRLAQWERRRRAVAYREIPLRRRDPENFCLCGLRHLSDLGVDFLFFLSVSASQR